MSNEQSKVPAEAPIPITTFLELFEHLGADYDAEAPLKDNEKRLSRRVYKDTSCGAWASLVPPGEHAVGKTLEKWAVSYQKVEGAEDKIRVVLKGPPGAAVTPWILDYFMAKIDPDGGGGLVSMMDWPTVVVVTTSDGEGGAREAECDVEVPVMAPHTGGVVFGSIVEGTDADVTGDEILFPTTTTEVDRALQYVEEMAEEIWNDTHGCPHCFEGADRERTDGEGAEGEGADEEEWEAGGCVDPECKHCHGQGIVI